MDGPGDPPARGTELCACDPPLRLAFNTNTRAGLDVDSIALTCCTTPLEGH